MKNSIFSGTGARTGDFTSSIGLVVKSDGYVQEAVPGMPAFESGLSPYMMIIGLNGRQFSIDELTQAIKNSKSGPAAITVLASNSGVLETCEIKYHGERLILTWSECSPSTTIWMTS